MTYGDHLDEELRAAGLRIDGCSSDGRIDWVSPPSPAEQATAAAVLAAHDPDRRKREHYAADVERREHVAHTLSATETQAIWDGLTAAQRSEATRRGLRALALLAQRALP